MSLHIYIHRAKKTMDAPTGYLAAEKACSMYLGAAYKPVLAGAIRRMERGEDEAEVLRSVYFGANDSKVRSILKQHNIG